VDHARHTVVSTFHNLRSLRYRSHLAYLQRLPFYSLYIRYDGQPPIAPAPLSMLHHQIMTANAAFKAGIDQDWRRSCLEYPRVLDYYFQLIEISFPADNLANDEAFVGNALHTMERETREAERIAEKKKSRRRQSRGRTTPPAHPMLGYYR
jgi:hypothetical protein